MSRSNRQQYKSRFNPVPAGGVGLDTVEQAKAEQNNQIRARVDGLAAAIFANNILVGDHDNPPTDSEIETTARHSYIAALGFARVAWGINAQMVSPPDQPSAPPQPITD